MNVALLLETNKTSHGSAIAIAVPVLAAVIIAAYSFIDYKRIVKLADIDYAIPQAGREKVKKKTKSEKTAYNKEANGLASSVQGILITSVIGTIIWVVFVTRVGFSSAINNIGSPYAVLAYKYLGTVLMILSVITSAIATYFAKRIRAFNY
jgi:amino acid transporter